MNAFIGLVRGGPKSVSCLNTGNFNPCHINCTSGFLHALATLLLHIYIYTRKQNAGHNECTECMFASNKGLTQSNNTAINWMSRQDAFHGSVSTLVQKSMSPLTLIQRIKFRRTMLIDSVGHHPVSFCLMTEK